MKKKMKNASEGNDNDLDDPTNNVNATKENVQQLSQTNSTANAKKNQSPPSSPISNNNNNNNNNHKRLHSQISNTNTDTNNNNNTTKNNNNDDKPKVKKAKRPKTKNLDPNLLLLRRTIQKCCATNDLHTAMSTYQTMHVEKDVKMEPQTFYNLLNLCGGSIGSGAGSADRIHVGTPKNTNNNNEDKIQDKDKQEDNSNKDKHKNGTPITPETRKDFALQLKQKMDDLHYPLNETAYTALVRLFSKSPKDFPTALQLLKQAIDPTTPCNGNKHHVNPKLRMFSPLLMGMCKCGDMVGALELWDILARTRPNHKHKHDNGEYDERDAYHLRPGEKEYCALMDCAIKNGDVPVMELVLGNLAEEVLVPCGETVDVVRRWFESDHAILLEDGGGDDQTSALDRVPTLTKGSVPSMGPMQYKYVRPSSINNDDTNIQSHTTKRAPKYEITTDVPIDTSTGKLFTGPLQNSTLKPVPLTNDAWIDMIKMNDTIVQHGEMEEHGRRTEYAGGGKGRKRIMKEEAMEKRRREWREFKIFLEDKVGPCWIDDGNGSVDGYVDGEKHSSQHAEEDDDAKKKRPFDIVIDGANVGYFKQNFTNAPKHVDYDQIDWVVRHFCRLGKRVLLVLHERHFAPNLMPHWAEPIVRRWEGRDDSAGKDGADGDGDVVLYRSPFGSNDDWFWMHAALWCGRGTMVLSNDEMRDHHFQMLAHRSFLRWKERHRVMFSFGPRIHSPNNNGGRGRSRGVSSKRRVDLKFPAVYSRRIQRVGDYGMVVPLPKRGDENRFLDGSHEADDSVPLEETYMCIKLQR